MPARRLVALVHDDLVPPRSRRRRGAKAGGPAPITITLPRRPGLLERAVPERRLAAGRRASSTHVTCCAPQRAPDADVHADAARRLGLTALARLAHEVRVGEVRARHADDVRRPSATARAAIGEVDDPARHEHGCAVAHELLRPGRGRIG